MNDYIKAFAIALIEHIKGTVPRNSHQVAGTGCDTCGYGADYEDGGLDEDALYREIDAFAETFKADEAHRQHKADREGA